MGTRADFYIGRGENAEWLGSIAWDGHPSSIGYSVLESSTADGFRGALANLAASRDDWTTPGQGWPWPWKNSATTDYAYAFDDGKVWGSSFGSPWFDASEDEPNYEGQPFGAEVPHFPDMSQRQNVTLGKRSGTVIIGI